MSIEQIRYAIVHVNNLDYAEYNKDPKQKEQNYCYQIACLQTLVAQQIMWGQILVKLAKDHFWPPHSIFRCRVANKRNL